jgi:hypothetical protein
MICVENEPASGTGSAPRADALNKTLHDAAALSLEQLCADPAVLRRVGDVIAKAARSNRKP